MNSYQNILQKIDEYKSKFYRRQLLIGVLSFLILNISLLLLFSFIEHKLWLGSFTRGAILIVFIASFCFTLWYLIINPILKILRIGKGKNDEDAAKDISLHFPEIEDKLINFLQLKQQASTTDQKLILAALDKKAMEFERFKFSSAVNFQLVKKYSFTFLAVIASFFLLSFISPELVNESPRRIVNYNKTFEREAPFRFIIKNDDFSVFRGDDFKLLVSIEGDAVPEDVKLKVNDKTSYSLKKNQNGSYEYLFERIQSSKKLQLNAEGFSSKAYSLNVLDRPELVGMNISVISPNYTGAGRQSYSNTGDITVLEGSRVLWEINGQSADQSKVLLGKDSLIMNRQNESLFSAEKRIFESSLYEIKLQNKNAVNKSKLLYKIDVIKDQFPEISTEFIPDSATYQFLTVAGSITDDYGFTSLLLNYKSEKSTTFSSIPIEINTSNNSQSFYATWNLDSVKLDAGEKVEVYLTVRDNDQINGYKKAKSKSFIFEIPSKEDIDRLIEGKSSEVQEELNKSKEDVKDIADRLSELEDKLKTDPTFDWQEKKVLEDLIKDKEEINRQIQELQKKYQELQQSANKFNKQSPSQIEKNEKFQELMNQLLDEETRKLYEKLQELMKENSSGDQINEQLNKLQNNERNLERDLERATELFKRLKMEAQLENSLQQLDSLSKQQDAAANESNLEQSQQQQEEIQKQFDDFREKMEKVLEMNQDLNRPEPLEDFEYEERQIAKELREIEDDLKNQENSGNQENSSDQENNESENGEEQSNKKPDNSQKKSNQTGQKQKNAAQKMKSLSQKLSNMQGNMQMEMMQANLDQLRDILDNLLKLSFNQEDLMNEMREVNQSDPRFLELSQNQLKLKDDSKVIQDSLLALASRVVQISSFVTEEVESINQNIEEALDFLKDRNRGRALSSQQFVMTSINNLALLLDDTMQQMQMSMAEASGTSKGENQQNQGIPDLQELQNQLGEKIEELKGSGKEGRELSEELARLAAEQELIRRQLEMIQEAEDGRPGGARGDDLKRAIQMMEQNEIDLVNKRLTKQLMYRQKQIETRLLEAEKSQREQETEKEREAEKPSLISREIPPGFEEYLKLKKKEIELLKTIPVELNPFYKKEVNDYFRRISRDQEE